MNNLRGWFFALFVSFLLVLGPASIASTTTQAVETAAAVVDPTTTTAPVSTSPVDSTTNQGNLLQVETVDPTSESLPPPRPGPSDRADPLRLGGEVAGESARADEIGIAVAASLPAGFVEQTVYTGLNFPTFVRFAPDGRVFVIEKRGTLLAFDSLTDLTPKTVVDFSGATYGWWDRGMLGMAIDPAFLTDPFIYLLYTTDIEGYGDACPDPPGGTTDGCVANARLSRIQVSASNNLVGAEQVLLDGFWCQQYPSHSIGQLQFGADGALYLSAGDGASFGFADWGQGGGSSGSPTPENPCGDPPVPVGGDQVPPGAQGGALRSQDLRTSGDPVTFDGAILRVNKATGAAFSGNPLLGGDTGDDRIIDYGLRNPFRFTFRPGTNDLWLGDVGWGVWEEINRISNPTASVLDFGWPCFEGSAPHGSYNSANLDICEGLYSQGGVTSPYFAYGHHESVDGCPSGGSSISGLAFYGGGPYPEQFDDALFFADFTRGCIWTMFPGANGLPSPSSIDLFATAAPSVGLEIGPNGDLFSVDHLGGRVLRYVFSGGNNPPVAVATASPTSGEAPLTVNFDGSGSSDPDSDPLTYAWDLDADGQFDDSTAVNPSFTYTSAGTRVVGLSVNDGQGGTDTDTVTITVTSGGGTGDGHVELPGLAGNYISAPDHSRLDITADIDLRADVSLADWQTNNAKLISKLGGAYEFMLNQATGGLRMAWRDSANLLKIRNSTATLPVADGARLQLRAALDVDNGAGGHTVTFYYRTNTALALSDNSGWTQLGNPVTFSGATSIRTDGTSLALGSSPGGGSNFWAGGYFRALILNASVVAANPDFTTTAQLTSTPPNYSSWQDTAGNPFTINGTSWVYNPGGGGGNDPPVATIAAPSGSETWFVGEQITFSGGATDTEDGTLPASSLDWTLTLHHCSTPTDCHQHPLQNFAGVASGSFAAPDHEYPSFLTLDLSAIDSGGLAGTDTVQLDPDTVDLTFQTVPAGLQLSVGSVTQSAPFVRTVIVGSQNSLSAPSPQSLSGTTYTFVSWSDGGSASHNVTAPTTDTTYAATFSTEGGGTGDGHVELPGLAGNYISAPDHSRLDITADIDLRADVSLADWQTNNAKLISKLGGAYEFMLNQATGGLRMAWRDSANLLKIRNSTATLPVADGARLQLRAALDVDNGAGGHTVTFYYRTNTALALSDNSGWTQLGNPVTFSGATSIRTDGTSLALGSSPGGGSNFWAGGYFRALILNASVVAANPDFTTTAQLTSTPPNYSSWQDTAGNPFTINGTSWVYNPGGGGGNNPPVAVATASPTSGEAPLTVNFDGSGSSDPDSDPLTYAWDLDADGQFDDSTAVNPSFTYTSAGTRVVGLSVNDGQGGTDTDTVTITVTSGGGTGDGHVELPGLAGNYISAPDHSRLDITADIDLRADVSLADWQTNNAKLISKLGGAYEFMLNQATGGLRMAWRDSANLLKIRNSTATLPVADGARLQLRAALDVDNGAGGHTVTFYYRTNTALALSDNSGWTQLGNPVTFSGATSIRTDGTSLALGSSPGGGSNFWAGGYFRALILNASVVAANPDFTTTAQLTSTPPNYSSWQDTAGNPFTINGTSWVYNPAA